jgi:hypothetical protein
LKARTDIVDVDHGLRLTPENRVAPTKIVILFLRFQSFADSIISRQALCGQRCPVAIAGCQATASRGAAS